MTVGVLVMSMDGYLSNFWPVSDGCVCLGPQPIRLLGSNRAKEYQDHLPLDMPEVAIKPVSTVLSVCLCICPVCSHLHPEQVLVCDGTGVLAPDNHCVTEA